MQRLEALRHFGKRPGWSYRLLGIGLFSLWLVLISGAARALPLQAASWITFIGLLITPGYFLGDLITWKLRLDWLERLALAFPLGIAILALPGTLALVQHWTLERLTLLWIITGGLVIAVWLLHRLWIRSLRHQFDASRFASRQPWAWDEILMLLLLIGAFILVFPTLSLDKIDGDAYAVATFTADALAGLPLNEVEPIFGTELGPGVRMIFNQFLTLSYLWSYLSGIDPITLTAVASRSMLALWALFASYTLGKAAGDSRRFGLFVASIQMLIYLAAPFVRGDNVSLFFFERTNADKFMVPITMLPVVFAFAMRYVRGGQWQNWLAAAVATVAVSTIHPLIAAMLALAVGAFGAFHLLLNLRSSTAWVRVTALIGLIIIVMLLPLTQLVLSRGEAQLASSYPSSFEGWPLGEKLIPIGPFVQIETMDLYGPLPEIQRLEARDANETTNPFLLWRFSVNMSRRRIILFDLNRYISDPSIMLEPPFLLTLLLIPLVIWRRRRDVAAQFAVSTSLAIVFVMYNPILTPVIGRLVMPWILWRFVWLLPYALMIALALRRIVVDWLPALVAKLSRQRLYNMSDAKPARYALLGCVVLSGALLSGEIERNIRQLEDRAASPYFYPVPERLLSYLNDATSRGRDATVLADADLSVTIPAYVAGANVVAHRAPTTSEVFPANRQDEALQRLIDQAAFFNSSFLTESSLEILRRYTVDYVVVPSGSEIDLQMQLAPDWFEWLLHDHSYSLYVVRQVPTVSDTIRGNTEMAGRRWDSAEALFDRALENNPDDLLALSGMASIAHARGQFSDALTWLEQAQTIAQLPALNYQIGAILVEMGDLETGRAELEAAQAAAPRVARYHIALGDACLAAGQISCASEQYELAVVNQSLPDQSTRLVAQGDLWRQQGRPDMALPHYEEAASIRSSVYNLFILESAYREAGEFDRSEQVLQRLAEEDPRSAEVLTVRAAVRAAQDDIDGAAALYRQAIWLQDLFAQESSGTYLALAQLLLSANRMSEAREALEHVLTMQPYNAAAYRLQGDLFRQQEQHEQALRAYERAYQLDPTQIDTYIALSNQLQLHGGRPQGIVELLNETIEANPDESILFLALGDQLQASQDAERAVDAYQAALDRLDVYAPTGNIRAVRSSGESRAFIYARLARVYEDQHDEETALNYYRAAVAAAPDTPWTHVLLGDAFRRDNQAAAAEAAYEQAIDSDAPYVDAYVGLSELYIDTGRYGEARDLLQVAIEAEVENSDPYIRLAELEQRSGNYDDALVWLREAAEIAVDSLSINTPLVDSLIRYGDYETALGYLEKALVLRPADAELMLRLGQVSRAVGDYAGAEAALLKARRLNRNDSRVYVELANVYLGQGRPEAAIAVYEMGVAVLPQESNFYVSLSQLQAAQGNHVQSLATLKEGLRQVSQREEIYSALATLYAQLGDLGLAETTLKQGIADMGERTPLLLALGRHYLARNDLAQAEEQFASVVEREGDAGAGHAALGDLALRREDPETAVVEYRRATEAEPENANYFLALAEAYASDGETGRAEAAYRQALALLPALENIHLSLARFYANDDRPEEARAAYERGIAMTPTSAPLLTAYARFLTVLGENEPALAILDRAVRLAPSAVTYVARADLYRSLGDVESASTDLLLARRLEPGSINALVALGDLYRDSENYVEAEKVYSGIVNLRPNLPVGYLRLGDLASRQGDLTAAQRYADSARAVEPSLQGAPDDAAQ